MSGQLAALKPKALPKAMPEAMPKPMNPIDELVEAIRQTPAGAIIVDAVHEGTDATLYRQLIDQIKTTTPAQPTTATGKAKTPHGIAQGLVSKLTKEGSSDQVVTIGRNAPTPKAKEFLAQHGDSFVEGTEINLYELLDTIRGCGTTHNSAIAGIFRALLPSSMFEATPIAFDITATVREQIQNFKDEVLAAGYDIADKSIEPIVTLIVNHINASQPAPATPATTDKASKKFDIGNVLGCFFMTKNNIDAYPVDREKVEAWMETTILQRPSNPDPKRVDFWNLEAFDAFPEGLTFNQFAAILRDVKVNNFFIIKATINDLIKANFNFAEGEDKAAKLGWL